MGRLIQSLGILPVVAAFAAVCGLTLMQPIPAAADPPLKGGRQKITTREKTPESAKPGAGKPVPAPSGDACACGAGNCGGGSPPSDGAAHASNPHQNTAVAALAALEEAPNGGGLDDGSGLLWDSGIFEIGDNDVEKDSQDALGHDEREAKRKELIKARKDLAKLKAGGKRTKDNLMEAESLIEKIERLEKELKPLDKAGTMEEEQEKLAKGRAECQRLDGEIVKADKEIQKLDKADKASQDRLREKIKEAENSGAQTMQQMEDLTNARKEAAEAAKNLEKARMQRQLKDMELRERQADNTRRLQRMSDMAREQEAPKAGPDSKPPAGGAPKIPKLAPDKPL